LSTLDETINTEIETKNSKKKNSVKLKISAQRLCLLVSCSGFKPARLLSEGGLR